MIRYSRKLFSSSCCIASGLMIISRGNAQANVTPTISRPFTLSFTVTDRDVTTAQWRKLRYNYGSYVIDQEIKGKIMKPEMRESALSEYLLPPKPDQQYQVALSYNGSSLLYKETRQKSPYYIEFTNDKTFEYGASLARENIYHQKPIQFIPPIPIPGVNLPHLSLLRQKVNEPSASSQWESIAFGIGSSTGDFVYIPAEVSMSNQLGRSAINSIISYNNDNLANRIPMNQWQFRNYQDFNGVAIASDISYTIYSNPIQWKADGSKPLDNYPMAPVHELDFHLISSSADPLPAVEFDPSHLLQDKNIVSELNHNDIVAFQYNAKSGNVDQQLTKARREQNIDLANAQEGKIEGRAKSGVFLLAALVLVGVGWFIKRRQS